MAELRLDGLREWWDKRNASEQRLVKILVATLVIGIIFGLVTKIRGDMDRISKSNQESREALRLMSAYRSAKARAEDTGDQIAIPDEAVAMDSYLEGIISELELSSPTYPAPKETEIGENVELSFEVKFKGLDIGQLTELLERIETGSKLVVVKELSIDTNFRDKETLDLDFTIATYRKKVSETEKEEEKEDSEG